MFPLSFSSQSVHWPRVRKNAAEHTKILCKQFKNEFMYKNKREQNIKNLGEYQNNKTRSQRVSGRQEKKYANEANIQKFIINEKCKKLR